MAKCDSSKVESGVRFSPPAKHKNTGHLPCIFVVFARKSKPTCLAYVAQDSRPIMFFIVVSPSSVRVAIVIKNNFKAEMIFKIKVGFFYLNSKHH